MQLSIIIPVYQSELSLPLVVQKTLEVVSGHFKLFEIICVDDGSKDGSWQMIKTLCSQHSNIRGLRLSRNFGQLPATICGLHRSSGRFLLTLDDDGQCDPAEGIQLVSMVQSGKFDVACGIRSCFKNKALEWISQVLFKKRHTSGLMAMSREVVFSSNGKTFPFGMGLDAYFRWMMSPARIGVRSVPPLPRIHGRSGYGILGLVRLIQRNIADYLGFRELAILSGLLWGAAAFGSTISTANLILLLCFGLMVTTYLSEIVLELKGKPYYWVIEEWPPN